MDGVKIQIKTKRYDTCPEDGCIVVDAEYVDLLSKVKIYWTTSGYPRAVFYQNGTCVSYQLHTYIYTQLYGGVVPDGYVIHHKNKCKWDERISNFEVTTEPHNAADRSKMDGTTSKYRGVSWNTWHSKWKSQITHKRRKITLGYFFSEVEAASAYDRAFLAVHKSTSGTNQVLDESEVNYVLEHADDFFPRPKRENRDLPVHITREHGKFRVLIGVQGFKVQKSFNTLEEAVEFNNTKMKEIQDAKEREIYSQPIVRDENGDAVISVKIYRTNKMVYTQVSDEDYYRLIKHKWYLLPDGRVIGDPGLMHCYIYGLPKGDKRTIDHIDRNTLNNKRTNLRAVSPSLQNRNQRKRKNTSSQYKGVTKQNNKWIAQIGNKGKKYHLGSFDNEEDARDAYQAEYDRLEKLEVLHDPGVSVKRVKV